MSSITLLKPYLHNGLSVEVPFTSEAFFNATIAAKPFGKVPKNWLRTEETQAYIQAIGRKCPIEQHQLVRVVSGAPETGGGTWLHPKLGIAFARWLDADFCVWCDEQIEAILRRDRFGHQDGDRREFATEAARDAAFEKLEKPP